MSTYSVHPYQSTDRNKWNNFLSCSNEGTIFHGLDFLSYHKDRFRTQEHHLLWLKGSTLFGLMPMGIFNDGDRLIAKSPYGASYGGPVFENPLDYDESTGVVEALLAYLQKNKIVSCQITLPIEPCYHEFSETFRFALLERGFRCVNRDISNCVRLDPTKSVWSDLSSRARNMTRKAQKSGVNLKPNGPIDDFWSTMEKTFEKHGTRPTHSIEEFQWLNKHLQEKIYVDVAYFEEKPIAGVAYFVINPRVNSSFYLSQDPEYQSLQALSWLICDGLERTRQAGFQWFDFGTSSINMKGRPNLFRFKESFGAVGFFRETYLWEC